MVATISRYSCQQKTDCYDYLSHFSTLLLCTCSTNLFLFGMEVFNNRPGFCPTCGSILPPLQVKGNVFCYNCKQEFLPEGKFEKKIMCCGLWKPLFIVYSGEKSEYTISFNTYDPRAVFNKGKREQDSEDADGPVVERKCPKCGNEKMSYATLQLRSADEGQTVFFTCLKCKYVICLYRQQHRYLIHLFSLQIQGIGELLNA